MRKRIILLIFLAVLTGIASAENSVLRIAVIYPEDAQNWPAEEAFFAGCPTAEIEYILYSEEQLNARTQAGTTGADLVILPYRNLTVLEEKGYLTYLDDTAGLTEYPEQIIDLSSLLVKNDRLFALPVSIAQDYWCWDESAGDAAGIAWPGTEAWTWEDCVRLAEGFPKDTDNDGEPDIWLMTGARFLALPAFANVNVDMFEEYLNTHSDFTQFMEQYLDLFRSFICCDALLDMDNYTPEKDCTLLSCGGGDNPIAMIDRTTEDGTGTILFLPPPVLEKDDVKYPGYLKGCAVLKDAAAPNLAASFIRAMISGEALNCSVFGEEVRLISAEVPEFSYGSSLNDQYLPVFQDDNGIRVFRLGAGRQFAMDFGFGYSEEAFYEAQKFRSLLTVNTVPYERDFYQEAFSTLQEWYLGHIDDAGLAERMSYLLGIAANRK